MGAATHSKYRGRFLFDPTPGWAMGYDNNQWIILITRVKKRKNRKPWEAVSFVRSYKRVLVGIFKENGINLHPTAEKALAGFPDRFLDWRGQHMTSPPS